MATQESFQPAKQRPGEQPDLHKTQLTGNQKEAEKSETVISPAVRALKDAEVVEQDAKPCTPRTTFAKRTFILNEILETEETYVSKLRVLVDVFIKPLRAAESSKQPILSQQQIRDIFGGLEVILGYNEVLLGMLRQTMQEWSEDNRIGHIFLKIAMFLKSYVSYVQNYEKAMETLTTAWTLPAFQSFMRTSAVQKALGKESLSSFLIVPIQRPPRYVLLLRGSSSRTIVLKVSSAS